MKRKILITIEVDDIDEIEFNKMIQVFDKVSAGDKLLQIQSKQLFKLEGYNTEEVNQTPNLTDEVIQLTTVSLVSTNETISQYQPHSQPSESL